MEKKFTLLLAGGVLLIVASTMGEGGPIDSIAKIDSGDAQKIQQLGSAEQGQAVADPVGSFAEHHSGSDWFAATPGPAQPAIPVYQYETVHIDIPPDVVDPKLVAASPIK